jgi:hypothetical protein
MSPIEDWPAGASALDVFWFGSHLYPACFSPVTILATLRSVTRCFIWRKRDHDQTRI